MESIRIVFWGTPEFSVPSLKALIDSPQIDVAAVITQPSKANPKSNKKIPSAVKTVALHHGLMIWEPEKLLLKKSKKDFLMLGPYDLNVIVAYGKIIPEWIIKLPKYSSINLHPSLLPELRGPSPIQTALLKNFTTTGISIMLIDNQMDHGPILHQEKIPILKDDTHATLSLRLAEYGSIILLKTMTNYINKKIVPKSQNHLKATFTKLFTKKDGQLDWSMPASDIVNKIRAFNPWPGTYTYWRGKFLKIIKADTDMTIQMPPGLVDYNNSQLVVGTGKGVLIIFELQLEGKRQISSKEFIRGYKDILKTRLPS